MCSYFLGPDGMDRKGKYPHTATMGNDSVTPSREKLAYAYSYLQAKTERVEYQLTFQFPIPPPNYAHGIPPGIPDY